MSAGAAYDGYRIQTGKLSLHDAGRSDFGVALEWAVTVAVGGPF